jgi:UDP-2-acetamido-2,6-beta-L-arabino-hexul-4-ose reductase
VRIGITGWQGFIGSYLKNKIVKPVLFKGNMKNLEEVKIFTRNCDRIYHLAGLNREKEGVILANNLNSTGNLLLASTLEKIEPEIIFLSTQQVDTNPNSEYGFTKIIEEEIVKRAKNWCVFRAPNVYGPGGKPFYNSVIATFTYQIAHGQQVTIDNATATREFIYIDELVSSLLKPQFNRIIHPEGEILSIGAIYEYLTSKLGAHKNLKKCLDFYNTGDKNATST